MESTIEVFKRKYKDEERNDIIIGDNKYSITKIDKFATFFDLIVTCSINYYYKERNQFIIIYNILKKILNLNTSINLDKNIILFDSFFPEPGFIYENNLYLNKNLINNYCEYDYPLIIDIQNLEISSIETNDQEKIKLSNKELKLIFFYIWIADHIATHFLNSCDNNKPDYLNHSDFLQKKWLTFSTCINIYKINNIQPNNNLNNNLDTLLSIT